MIICTNILITIIFSNIINYCSKKNRISREKIIGIHNTITKTFAKITYEEVRLMT